jgi:beta-galactosidase
MHYPRVPPEYWSARLALAKAMGLTAVSTYVFWNRHERVPGMYDFAGENDVAQFMRLAQQHELDVILRPGPYVCAEWDFGGLPAWLLQDGEIPIRSTDERFLAPARRWLLRLGEELATLQRQSGGPIIAVQLENEYGAFGSDAAYLRAIRSILVEAGFGPSPLYTIDQPDDLARGALEDVPIAATFAPGDPGAQFVRLQALRPGAPPLCGEYWAGWFDHWGEQHARLDDAQQVRDLEWMLSQGVSLNIYMLHGGTNFGFWNGANAFDPHPYQPTTTSYDYQAAIDEAGRPTEKYHRFREAIARCTGLAPRAVPDVPAPAAVEPFVLDESLPLVSVLPDPLYSELPLPMESLGQHFGYVLYRTTLRSSGVASLRLDARDYAVVSVNGRIAGHVDRRLDQDAIEVQCELGADLDILVENGGRINYGSKMPGERKGIVGDVLLDGIPLRDWKIYRLPLETPPSGPYAAGAAGVSAFYRGSFTVAEPRDTFLDMTGLRKGALWVNGRNAGRVWEVGPQRSLYVPAPWLRKGRNEVVALELFPREAPPRLSGRSEPVRRSLQ